MILVLRGGIAIRVNSIQEDEIVPLLIQYFVGFFQAAFRGHATLLCTYGSRSVFHPEGVRLGRVQVRLWYTVMLFISALKARSCNVMNAVAVQGQTNREEAFCPLSYKILLQCFRSLMSSSAVYANIGEALWMR